MLSIQEWILRWWKWQKTFRVVVCPWCSSVRRRPRTWSCPIAIPTWTIATSSRSTGNIRLFAFPVFFITRLCVFLGFQRGDSRNPLGGGHFAAGRSRSDIPHRPGRIAISQHACRFKLADFFLCPNQRDSQNPSYKNLATERKFRVCWVRTLKIYELFPEFIVYIFKMKD